MTYYHCDINLSDFKFSTESFDERMKQIRELNQKISAINSRKGVGYQLFLYYPNDNSASFCFAVRQRELAQNAVSDALKELGLASSSAYSNEISPHEFTEKLRECLGVKYIHDDRLIQLLGGKVYLSRMHEAPIKETASKTELIQRANDLLYGQTLVPEIERIYAGGKADTTSGHPVHYIVKSDDIETCEAVTDVLLSALAGNNRLKNKNSCRLTIDGKLWTHDDHIKTLRSVSGGAAVILCHKERYERDNSDETIKQMCDMLSKYNRDILFVFQMPANSKTADKLISRNTCGITFVCITEETLAESEDMPFAEEVHNYLRGLAESTNVKPTDDLFKDIVSEREYHAKELNTMFDRWHNNRLKKEAFPQYAELEAQSEPLEYEDLWDCEADENSAYNELFGMIGLTEAKAVIQQALDFHKAQTLYRGNGIKQERPPMHMVFTGNPGSAKTTVARLFAHILKENGLIENGKIIEVSRANLVGKYIGHTAPLVMDVFKQAKGGILFVDEAHTLLDSRENSFGDEAVDALVKQMEDMRNEVIVILAGYPAEIEALLTRNPGLRSRINFHVPFSDYDTDELYAITELIANKQGLALADDVKPKLMTIYSAAVKQADAGNGRLARSLIEKARLKQASRLVKMNPAQISKSDFALTADDFEVPVFRQDMRRIGFGAG